MSSLIRYPNSLNQDLRRRIKNSFESAIESFDDDDVKYVLTKCRRVVSRLGHTDDWHLDLAHLAELLFAEFESNCVGNHNVKSPAMRLIGAALFYFCNPFDIVPDHDLESGYVDDAYVFDLCLQNLVELSPATFDGIGKALRSCRTGRR